MTSYHGGSLRTVPATNSPAHAAEGQHSLLRPLTKFTYAVRGQKRHLSRFVSLKVIFSYERQWELTATATQLFSFPGGSSLEPGSQCFQQGLPGLQLRTALPAPHSLPRSSTTRCGSPRRRPFGRGPCGQTSSPPARPLARRRSAGDRPRPASPRAHRRQRREAGEWGGWGGEAGSRLRMRPRQRGGVGCCGSPLDGDGGGEKGRGLRWCDATRGVARLGGSGASGACQTAGGRERR